MRISTNLNIAAAGLPAKCDEALQPFIAAALGISQDDIVSYFLRRRSVDARSRGNVRLLYALDVDLREGVQPAGAYSEPRHGQPWQPPDETSLRNPIIVGAGPAGLFAALVLAEAGAAPIVLERGRDVQTRQQDINAFLRTRRLNPESNYLFGEGGAGTWSDGKLYTRVHDERAEYVLQAFVQAGAPREILYYAHPHIGSDLLPGVIASLRRRIVASGGRFLWNTRVVDIAGTERFQAVRTDQGVRLDAPAALLACGHSARELILALTRRIAFRLKPFQMGCRIEHPQEYINEIRHGRRESFPALGAAEYLFSTNGNGRVPGATTFCMCPGGQIIPATCRENSLATNGMSNAARNGKYANSAIISTLGENTFSTPSAAFAFLERIEAEVFSRGGGDYTAPAQRAVDFLERRMSRVQLDGSYLLGLESQRLDVLAAPVYAPIANALRLFEKQTP
ncbi:MAG: FAD-dependent monooxygenase, partial [Victivallales bacterium]|nr:FAD-dependent monooxygenase [Victivallales bacterium]